MTDKKYYINFKSNLAGLSKQNLKELFKYTQTSKGINDESIHPILYFSGTASQSWKRHFQMFKNKYLKADDKPNEESMDKVELFANYTCEFDFPENGILKWSDWHQKYPDYDPSVLNLDAYEVININEQRTS